MKRIFAVLLLASILFGCNAKPTVADSQSSSDNASSIPTSDTVSIPSSDSVISSDNTSTATSESTSTATSNSTSTTTSNNTSAAVTSNSTSATASTNEGVSAFPTLEDNFAKITKTPRKRGTAEEFVVRDYLKAQLESYGYSVAMQKFDIFEMTLAERAQYDFFAMNPLNKDSVAQAYNIVADLNYDKNKKTVVFSAHYDSTTGSIGALDNASGTVAVLEMAKLIRNEKLNYNVRIIFFSSEEYSFHGSRSYLNSLSSDELANIYGCFNVDMVGSKDCRKIMLQEASIDGNWIAEQYKKINGDFEFRQGGSSDNIPFSKKGITAVCFTTVDTRANGFNQDLFNAELDNKSVSLENLKTDIGLIINFAKGITVQ